MEYSQFVLKVWYSLYTKYCNVYHVFTSRPHLKICGIQVWFLTLILNQLRWWKWFAHSQEV